MENPVTKNIAEFNSIYIERKSLSKENRGETKIWETTEFPFFNF